MAHDKDTHACLESIDGIRERHERWLASGKAHDSSWDAADRAALLAMLDGNEVSTSTSREAAALVDVTRERDEARATLTRGMAEAAHVAGQLLDERDEARAEVARLNAIIDTHADDCPCTECRP